MDDIALAAQMTVYSLFRSRAIYTPHASALEQADRSLSYSDLLDRVDRLAAALDARGVMKGDRIAVLSENRFEYTEIQLACAKLGATTACQNWRLSRSELQHCLDLVTPKLIFVSARFAEMVRTLEPRSAETLVIEEAYEALLDIKTSPDLPSRADPESGLLLIYTSGTTGLPKAALISHRAEIARMTVLRMDLHMTPDDCYLAWSPMFHMGGTEHTLATVMSGGTAIIVDGLDLDAIIAAIATRRLSWLLLVPATIEPLLEKLRQARVKPLGVKVVGCMADLVPHAVIADISSFLRAPFLNSFGATETGLPPLSGGLLEQGITPASLTKRLSSMCEFRLVDPGGKDVADGDVGEGAVRGPTLFSGYWNAEETNAREFRGGWFRMGDLFRRMPDGGYDFAGRAKYMIKSGGENIYPAEIERVLLSDTRVADAVVVRKPDARWGEVPVAFIARLSESLTEDAVEALCRRELAGYKRPREIHFVALEDFPRSTSGKIIREEMELRLAR